MNDFKDSCFILQEYLTILEKYKSIYGEKCIVLYQNGKFFEFYGVDNDNEKLGDVKEMSKILGLQLARRNNSILENSRKNFIFVGFPTYQIDRYVNLLLEDKYTCVIVEQYEDPLINNNKTERKTRKVTGIVGPSTNIKYIVTSNNNYLVCLFVQKHSDKLNILHKSHVKYQTNQTNLTNLTSNFINLSISMASIDVSTGEINCYDCYNTYDDEYIVYDETNRFITTMNPSEMIIYVDDDIKDILLNNIINEGILLHIRSINDINKEYYKLPFQNQYLSKIYKNCGLLQPIQFLEMEKFPTLILTLLLIIDFCYNQNENIVNNLDIPKLWNYKKYLILDNTTLSQLNIIEKSEDCILTILDKTSTAMGRRYFRQRISLPYVNKNMLNDSYNIIEDMRNMNENKYEYENCELILKDINDIERFHRKINLGIITYDDFIKLQISYKEIIKLFEISKKYRHTFHKQDIQNAIYYINYVTSFIKPESVNNEHKNIFHKGIYSDLDNLEDDIKTYDDSINKLLMNMNSIIGQTDSITLKFDKDSELVYVTCTSNRWNIFTNKNKDLHNKNKDISLELIDINNINPSTININEWYKVAGKDTKDVKMTCDKLISFSQHYENMKKDMNNKNMIYFKQFINSLWDKYEYFMTLIVQYVAELDYYKSCAKCSILMNYCKPVIEQNDDDISSYIKSEELRHALIEKIQTKIPYIAQNVDLTTERQLLLFGVNCSGKSSYMRAIGVAIIMAQSGMYVPAKSFTYWPYENILTRIIGNDDIRHGKSTFAVEMGELRSILKRANKNSLILGDEICHGTESTSAVSILSSSILKLNEVNCNCVFTTHLHPVVNITKIKELYTSNRLGLYHFKVINDNGKLTYDRRLEKGSGSSLYGLEVAKAMNFSYDFIHLANEIRKELLEINPILDVHRSKYNKDMYVNDCEICHNKAVDTHHIKFQSCADDNGYIGHIHKDHMSNLVALCKSCHQKVHASPATIIINGYIQKTDGIILDYKETLKVN